MIGRNNTPKKTPSTTPGAGNFTQNYNSQKGKDVLRKEAYPKFEAKYVKRPFEEFDLFESQERFLAKKLNFFMPGRVYTFQYDPINKDRLAYYDRRPIVLVHSQYISQSGNVIIQGLNINFLPELARVQVLDIFMQTFKSDIEAAEKQVAKNQIGIFKMAWKVLTDWFQTYKIFGQAGKIAYSFAFRNYIIGQIKQPVLVEIEDYEMLPYILPKEFKGKTPQEIWTLYAKEQPKMIKKVPNEQSAKASQKKYTKPGGA